MRQGSGGVKSLCDALRLTGLGHGRDFSASTEESVIESWVHGSRGKQLLIIDPAGSDALTPLILQLKGKNPLLSVAVIGTGRGSSAGIDHFIPVNASSDRPFSLMTELVHGFSKSSPQSSP